MTDEATTPRQDAAGSAADDRPAPDADGPPLTRALEAILFVADQPMSLVSLASAVSRPVREVRDAVHALRDDYDGAGGGVRRGFELREVGGGWRMYVREELDDIVGDFVLTSQPARLSQAALETLAVIAYKQPVTRAQVAQVRAVNVDSVVRTLVARGLIADSGQDPVTGGILYRTTDELLVRLGISSLDALPKISPLLDDGQDGFHEQL